MYVVGLLLNTVATMMLFPFLMASMNITIRGERSNVASAIAVCLIIFILWRVWA